MFSEDVRRDGIGLEHCILLIIFKLSSFKGLLFLLTAPCSAMAYHHDSRRIFVGQDNGAIMVSCLTSLQYVDQNCLDCPGASGVAGS